MFFSGRYAAVVEFASMRLTVTAAKPGRGGEKTIIARASESYEGYFDGEFRGDLSDMTEALGRAVENAQKTSGVRLKEFYVGVPASFIRVINNESAMIFGGPKKISQRDVGLLREMAGNFGEEAAGCMQIESACRGVFSEGERLMSLDDVTGRELSAEYTFLFADERFTDAVNSAFGRLGLTVKKFISTEKAEVVYLMTQQQRKDASVLVDCGELTTDVAVCEGAGFAAIESICDGGGYLSDALSERLGISFEEADVLKEKINLNLECKPEDVYTVGEKVVTCCDVNGIAAEWIEELAGKVGDVLEKVSDKLSSNMVFCLTGGGLARIIGAPEAFSAYFDGTPVITASAGGTKLIPSDDAAGSALIAAVIDDIKA